MAQYPAIDTPAKYEIQVRNTSPDGTSETVTVRGPASDAKWTIAYFDENDLTAQGPADLRMLRGDRPRRII